MIPVGLCFLDRDKAWGPLAAGRVVPLIDVAYATVPTDGFSAPAALDRLIGDCDLLWSQGVQPRPYLRLDFAPGHSCADDPQVYKAAEYVMRRWCDAPRAPLTIIVGNEPNLEGPVWPAEVAASVAKVATLRDLLGYPVRVFAPAIAPWNPVNVNDPQDFMPGVREFSTEWENWQYGLARRLKDAPIDGYALHSYGRPLHVFDAQEPSRDNREARGAQWGWRWYRDALVAIDRADPRGLPVVLSEVNTRTDRPSSESYPAGWLPAAMADLEVHASERIDGVCWFVGEGHGGWSDESTRLRTGQLCHADDDLNALLGRAP